VDKNRIYAKLRAAMYFLSKETAARQSADSLLLKVKESRNRPGVTQRFPGSLGSQIS
jgi:hypothetical protein